MKSQIVAVLAMVLCLGSQGALAAETAANNASRTDQSGAAGNENTGDRMICRREPVTGSRLETKKRCLTKNQWQAESEDAQRQLGRPSNNRVNPNQ